MFWKIPVKVQILILSFIGIYRTIKEFYDEKFEELCQTNQISDSPTLSFYQNIFFSVLSGIVLVRKFTGHVYIASYILIMFPLLTGKMRKVLLVWLSVVAVRSILLNFGVTIMGIVICSSQQETSLTCFRFVAEEVLDLCCSVYMWTVVNDFYHTLKVQAILSRLQSNTSESSSVIDEASSSFLSDDWSLPSSLVAELRKNTEDELIGKCKKINKNAPNVVTRSVDSLLAHAMVNWLMKKMFKLKSKQGNEPLIFNKSDVDVLRKELKKSIANIDKEDIKDFMAQDKSTSVQTAELLSEVAPINENKKQATFGKGGRVISDANLVDTNKVENSVTHPLSNDVDHAPTNDTDLLIEPSQAVNLVKQLFENSAMNFIENSKKNMASKSTELASQLNRNHRDTNKRFDELKNCNCVFNESAFNSSLDTVKSLLGEIVDTSTKDIPSFKEVGCRTNETRKVDRFSECRYLKSPFTELQKDAEKINLFTNPINKRPIIKGKKITMIQADDFSDFPQRVRSVLKKVNVSSTSEKNSIDKPSDKENEYERVLFGSKKESQMSVKSLRYHYRRSIPMKMPLKRSRDNGVNSQTLKAIMQEINSSDSNALTNYETSYANFIRRNLTSNQDRIMRPNKISSSVQTVSSKRLLNKIKEMEEKLNN